MKSFFEILHEAFPPKKDATTGPPAPKKANPFQKKGGPPSPQGNSFSKGEPDDVSLEDDASPFPNQNPHDPSAQDGTELYMLQQQMSAEREQAEAEARRQQAEQEAAERQRIKKMRLAATQEVADALDGKYNDQDDTVTFFPDIISFARYEEDKQNGQSGDVEVRHGQETSAGKKAESDQDDADDDKGVDDRTADDAEDAEKDNAAQDVDEPEETDDAGIDLDDDADDADDTPTKKKK